MFQKKLCIILCSLLLNGVKHAMWYVAIRFHYVGMSDRYRDVHDMQAFKDDENI